MGLTRRRRRSFTLMELLVVVGIIMVLTAMAIPAVSKFLDGQSLSQSGRILQSAFNEARRAAITQRSKNYLVFFRKDDPSKPGEYLFGMRRYRERVGYEGEEHLILAGVMFDLETGSVSPAPPAGVSYAGRIRGINIPVFADLPDETFDKVFGASNAKKPVEALGWIEFRRDGTIRIETPLVDHTQSQSAVGNQNIFDLNEVIQVDQTTFDALPDKVDLNLREAGDHAVDKRCFVHIDPNTGRVNLRTLQVQ